MDATEGSEGVGAEAGGGGGGGGGGGVKNERLQDDEDDEELSSGGVEEADEDDDETDAGVGGWKNVVVAPIFDVEHQEFLVPFFFF